MKTVLSFVGMHPIIGTVYLDHAGPSISPSRWRPFCLEQFLRVQVPLGCVKTAFVSQARICQDNGSEYTQVCLGTALLTLQRTTKAIAHMSTD